MRSHVDLPQPEGPSRQTNSLSFIADRGVGYRFEPPAAVEDEFLVQILRFDKRRHLDNLCHAKQRASKYRKAASSARPTAPMLTMPAMTISVRATV